ncbi:MAG: T9SS type A sorting domain-containing protein [Bacteroidales bacterium]|nr:T9SS type A sorting domain-containing protein [Bacteroidales bacterium]
MKLIRHRIAQHLKSLFFVLFLIASLITKTSYGQSITIQSPNGGEVWNYGGYETTSWTGQNIGVNVRIEFSPDGGTSWWIMGDFTSGPNGGITPVQPFYFSTTNALLKITDFSNPEVSDISDAPFTVNTNPISIYQPASGSVVFVNTLTYVNWIVYDPDISLLNAEISTDGGLTYKPVAQNINAQNGFAYLILSDIPAEACVLKLYNAMDPSEFVVSTPFTISAVPSYNLTSPAGGEIVNIYSPLNISWTVENSYSDNCNLEYSTDNGETWVVINNVTSTGNFGSYEWTTPNVNSDECLIRISDLYAQSAIDISAAFTIMPYPETPVCLVTVDSLTKNNVIIFEKPVSDLISDFLVYKETDEANVYEIIDTLSYEEVPIVTDFSSDPAMRPYRYKIGFQDSENRVFPAGDYHQTIHLIINQGVNNSWNLIWTPYVGINYASCNILRKSKSGNYEQIATVSSSFNSFTDFNAPQGDIAYIVSIVHPTGCGIGMRATDVNIVYSNEASLSLSSLDENKEVNISIYPVPANDLINIQFGDNSNETINLTITDVTGRIIYSKEFSDVLPGQVHSINSTNYAEGMYLLNVISSGNKSTRKIVIQH